jgi:hypothetical protein
VPDWANVETVEVEARPGPAVWHLTRGSSEVWILGTVGQMPKGLDWNKQYLSDLLDGARAIITPPRVSVSLFDAGWFLISYGGRLSLSRGQKLEAIMPEPMRARFVATRTALGQDEGRYQTDSPIRAAMRLQQDSSSKLSLTGQEPMQTISKLARDKHVPAEPAMKWDPLPVAKEVLTLSIAQQQACLAEAVEDVDRQQHHAAAAAQAWAVGDVRSLKANFAESRLSDCIVAAAHSYSNMNEQTIAAFVGAVDAALDKPGKTVAVIGMGPLLRKDGVLARLEARHIAIEGPAE